MSEAQDLEEILPKTYNAAEAEARWYRLWREAGIFQPRSDSGDAKDAGKPYVIMMPPPNVTGSLHMGHALVVTIQDILTRYHRMQGRDTLWLPGTDHAGIATQAVVERELWRSEKKTRHDLGREAFLERVWAWKNKNGERILEQLTTLGTSADWSRLRFTMDDTCSRAVKEAFVRMWDDGLIYRGERLVNWDPKTQTALSDEEVDHEERQGELWRFAYPLQDDGGELIVATTRPETMLGDTAVAVHPDDERHQHLIGRSLRHPFFPDRHLPIIADSYVDPKFGTGAVKITPAHDPNDFEVGQRHRLPFINILTLDGRINEQGGDYKGLDRYEARKKIKADLEALELTRGAEALTHNVAISQRSGVAIEPMLSRQYFVKTKPLAAKAQAAVKSGETRIVPSSWVKTWDHFMDNIRDWCISRQLWWGHRIPVFYDLDAVASAIEDDARKRGCSTEASEALSKGVVGRELLTIALNCLDDESVRGFSRASCQDLSQDSTRFIQEEDVLDTWFSSGLWPFSTLGWPDQTADLERFYPGSVLETGFDILFFWVARMMMMGTYFMDKAPFSDVYLHAMVRDSQGRKMSKSLGNTIDPLDVISGISLDELLAKIKTYPVPEQLLPNVIKGVKKEYPDGIPASGADGIRFSLASLSGQGRDIKLSIPRVAGYRAFLNKIWNATRFALMRVGNAPLQSLDEAQANMQLADRWILDRLQHATERARKSVEHYRFNDMADSIYQFFWSELCDWYIEFVKTSLAEESDPAQSEAARCVLMHVLDESMRLLHPICPFQSEEIWQKLPGRHSRWDASIRFCAEAPYPQKDEAWIDHNATNHFAIIQETIFMVRNARQESGLPAQKKVPAIILVDEPDIAAMLRTHSEELCRLAKITDLSIEARQGFIIEKNAATNSGQYSDVVIPLEGLIDLKAESNRLEKELKKLTKERDGLARRLGSQGFLDKAPPQVVEESKSRLTDLDNQIGRINQRLKAMN
jgi:valyl-tRNA synthetase